ncbi:RNA polymerase sigma factor, sigma-70 family [Novosphingobium resinovorum]|uniref:RNA polymerase sigma factor, sigma-70 family n=3 Tax=Sphingomonadaceae TaxID=41297 RepID=A0A031JP66_9SPHN|nr:sigma-70 family RNA polymerase sigma factor [Novosphingobium resinovorum]EZP75637.1 RNA polymerase sigma factor, sigma-70 family [Novosphingobium resinovorum]
MTDELPLEDAPREEAWPALMQRAQDGDQRAYRLVLRALVPVVRVRVRRRIFDDVLAEDVVQEVLMTLHRLRHTYDPALPLMPWVSAIVSARSVDALRRQGRSRGREINREETLDGAIDPVAAAAFEAIGAERELAGMLNLLPERQRQMIEMVKLQEMSLDAAAQESRLSVSAVKSLLHRAIVRLREHGKQTHG